MPQNRNRLIRISVAVLLVVLLAGQLAMLTGCTRPTLETQRQALHASAETYATVGHALVIHGRAGRLTASQIRRIADASRTVVLALDAWEAALANGASPRAAIAAFTEAIDTLIAERVTAEHRERK